MLFWLIIAVGIILTIVCAVRESKEWFGEPGLTVFLGAVTTVMATIAVFLMGGLFLGANTTVRTESGLKALGTDEKLGGHYFILGGGILNESSTYKVMKETDSGDGGFFMKEVNVSSATIYEDTTAPYMVKINESADYPWLFPFAFGRGDTYEFHVPTGTVVQNYNVDVND